MSRPTPKTNVEILISFQLKGDVVLTAEQEELLARVCFADIMLRSRKYSREDVVDRLRKKFPSLSKYRAEQDITDSHKIFGETRKINKAYLLSHHIEDIGQQIQMMKEARKFELLPKLNDNYTYALNSMPVEIEQHDNAPASVQMILNTPEKPTVDIVTLLNQADNILKHGNAEYLPFEPVTRSGRQDHLDGDDGTADGGSISPGE